jgi:hypothetical protein
MICKHDFKNLSVGLLLWYRHKVVLMKPEAAHPALRTQKGGSKNVIQNPGQN